jgi:hypothetical protein
MNNEEILQETIEVQRDIIDMVNNKIKNLEDEIKYLKSELSLARKGKRKSPEIKKKGGLIMFPTNRTAKESR